LGGPVWFASPPAILPVRACGLRHSRTAARSRLRLLPDRQRSSQGRSVFRKTDVLQNVSSSIRRSPHPRATLEQRERCDNRPISVPPPTYIPDQLLHRGYAPRAVRAAHVRTLSRGQAVWEYS